MSLTSKSIRMVLEIKDPNIIFTQDAVIEEIRGAKALVFYAELKLQPEHCPACGLASKLVRYGFERTCVLMPSYSYRPTYMKLSRQRFRCELCRTAYAITKYFEGFPLSVRQQVQTVSLDLNAGYINLVPRLFPNAKIVVDRFHIVQMVSTALNMVRIQVMKGLSKRSKEYRFMKREWKIFLKDFNEPEAIKPTYHTSIGYYETTVNLVANSLDLSPEFRAAYEVYQEIIGAVRKRDASTLAAALESYRSLGNRMDQSIKTLKKYKRQVINALRYEYSNVFLEGINGIIKKIKNTAYGYTNWNNFINRIFLERVWFRDKSSKAAA